MKNHPALDEWLEKLSPGFHLITRELMAVARKIWRAQVNLSIMMRLNIL